MKQIWQTYDRSKKFFVTCDGKKMRKNM